MDYFKTESLADIKAYSTGLSSGDGEDSRFELKGTAQQKNISKDLKKKIAREICAFANTYGGTICLSYGSDADIEKFPDDIAQELFKSFEDWSKIAIEPHLAGIEIKIVDSVFLIRVPESKNKPHRVSSLRDYFYRHQSSSTPMSEIMISSMYRSQDYLDFSMKFSVMKGTQSQLRVNAHIRNQSRVPGTLPKVEINLYGNAKNPARFLGRQIKPISFLDQGNLRPFSGHSWTGDFGHVHMASLKSNKSFSENLLYPEDYLNLDAYSASSDIVKDLTLILAKIDCAFKESVRQTEYHIIRLLDVNKSETVLVSKENNHTPTLIIFSQLCKDEE